MENPVQATTQSHNKTQINTTENNNASRRGPHDESLLDQATVQPRNKNEVSMMTDNDGLTIDASPQHEAAVENNDHNVNASCEIQQ